MDPDDFRRSFEPHRGELHAHCYRMLGSLHDAEDAMQEVMLRAWRALPGFAGRSSMRTWLYRIATNCCLDVLAKRPPRGLPESLDAHGAPEPEDPVSQSPADGHELRERAEIAVRAAFGLPPRQRSVLIMREALGMSAREIAAVLGTSTASVNSALQRARAALDDEPAERGQAPDDVAEALHRGDAEGLVALLTAPAGRHWSYA